MNDNAQLNRTDVHVGARLKSRRLDLKLTRGQLAARLGLNASQVQQHELGQQRIGAALLFNVASSLNVPIGYFYECLNLGLVNPILWLIS